jgi:hypothetical protein
MDDVEMGLRAAYIMANAQTLKQLGMAAYQEFLPRALQRWRDGSVVDRSMQHTS